MQKWKIGPIKYDGGWFKSKKFLIAQEKNFSMLMCSIFVSCKAFLYHRGPWPA